MLQMNLRVDCTAWASTSHARRLAPVARRQYSWPPCLLVAHSARQIQDGAEAGVPGADAQGSSARSSAAPPAPSPSPNPAASEPAMAVGPEDDSFARAWKPPPGEPPLWFVEKFEARRKEEAQRKVEDPAFVTTLDKVSQDRDGKGGDNPAVAFIKGMLQVVQLLVVLSLLLLFPAAMHDGGLSAVARPWTTFAFYLAFFGLGTIARMVKHGRLVPRSADKQVASWAGRLAFVAFVVVVPLLHWAAMYRYVGLSLYTSTLPAGTTLYDVAGGLGMAAATALNALASRELGPAYDRVAVPPVLVTSGPYRWMQHPIYASYILLFFSYGMWLHSAPAACALLLACGLYYRGRTALEGKVLEGAFGTYYRDYAARTKCWLIL